MVGISIGLILLVSLCIYTLWKAITWVYLGIKQKKQIAFIKGILVLIAVSAFLYYLFMLIGFYLNAPGSDF